MHYEYEVCLPLEGRLGEWYVLCRCRSATAAAAVIETLMNNDHSRVVTQIMVRIVPVVPA